MPSDPGATGSAAPLPISPELILVAPPEEARLAREQLADPAPGDWDEFLANIRARAAASETAGPAEALPRPKRRVRLTVIAAVVIAAAAAFGIVRAVRGHDETAPAVFRTPTIAEGTQTHRAVAPKPTKGQKPSKPAARAPGRKPKKTPTFVPARVFSWPPERAATRYLVRFFRNGHKVLEARTVRARFVLPKSFVFRPGSYRWTVVPLGVAGKGPLVDSKFVIS
jgi:hypothetical protein